MQHVPKHPVLAQAPLNTAPEHSRVFLDKRNLLIVVSIVLSYAKIS